MNYLAPSFVIWFAILLLTNRIEGKNSQPIMCRLRQKQISLFLSTISFEKVNGMVIHEENRKKLCLICGKESDQPHPDCQFVRHNRRHKVSKWDLHRMSPYTFRVKHGWFYSEPKAHLWLQLNAKVSFTTPSGKCAACACVFSAPLPKVEDSFKAVRLRELIPEGPSALGSASSFESQGSGFCRKCFSVIGDTLSSF